MGLSSSAAVNRELRFNSLDEAVAEAERLVAAEREGKLARRGSWTLGQALNHLATWMDFPYVGFPEAVKVPLVVRWILRWMRKGILEKGLSPGVKLRGVPGGTVGAEAMETSVALEKFKGSVARLKTTEPVFASPAFGALSRKELEMLNLRHAELHLGFQEVVI